MSIKIVDLTSSSLRVTFDALWQLNLILNWLINWFLMDCWVIEMLLVELYVSDPSDFIPLRDPDPIDVG